MDAFDNPGEAGFLLFAIRVTILVTAVNDGSATIRLIKV
jgi:hypothetical protein